MYLSRYGHSPVSSVKQVDDGKEVGGTACAVQVGDQETEDVGQGNKLCLTHFSHLDAAEIACNTTALSDSIIGGLRRQLLREVRMSVEINIVSVLCSCFARVGTYYSFCILYCRPAVMKHINGTAPTDRYRYCSLSLTCWVAYAPSSKNKRRVEIMPAACQCSVRVIGAAETKVSRSSMPFVRRMFRLLLIGGNNDRLYGRISAGRRTAKFFAAAVRMIPLEFVVLHEDILPSVCNSRLSHVA